MELVGGGHARDIAGFYYLAFRWALIVDGRDELGRGGFAHPSDVLVHHRNGGGLEAQVNKIIEANERDFFPNAFAGIMAGLELSLIHI